MEITYLKHEKKAVYLPFLCEGNQPYHSRKPFVQNDRSIMHPANISQLLNLLGSETQWLIQINNPATDVTNVKIQYSSNLLIKKIAAASENVKHVTPPHA